MAGAGIWGEEGETVKKTAKLPNDEPRFARVAWPDGMRVLVGPLDYGGMVGVIDWSADVKQPAGRYFPSQSMTEMYGPNLVPVRHGFTVTFHHQRWILPQ